MHDIELNKTETVILFVVVFSVTAVVYFTVAIGVFVPLFVSLTCYRANYTPKAVALTNDENNESTGNTNADLPFVKSIFFRDSVHKLGAPLQGLFSTCKRIHAIEGWRGLYRGTWLVLIQGLVLLIPSMFALYAMYPFNEHTLQNPSPIPFGVVILLELISFVLVLPVDVLKRRTMVHPKRLCWTRPVESLKEVLTAEEYNQPWRLYLLPCVVSTKLLQIFIVNFLAPMGRLALAPPILSGIFVSLVKKRSNSDAISMHWNWFTILLYIIWAFFVLVALLLLDNIYVRATTQRVGPSCAAVQSSRSNSTTTGDSQATVEQNHLSASESEQSEEPIVSLRPCLGNNDPAWTFFGASHVEPYTSIMDMVRKMQNEEGNRSLTRGFMYTVLGHLYVV